MGDLPPATNSNFAHVNFKDEPSHILATEIQRLEEYASGRGGLADVWKCSMSQIGTGRLIAVKSIRISGQDALMIERIGKRIRRETHVWMRLKHNRILPFEGVTIATEFGPLPALVSPWMEEGSLDSYLNELKHKGPALTDVQKRELIRQVASGLSYLHGEDVVHGDLTATNVLVDGSGCVCLADFGLSMILAEAGNATFNSCHAGNVRWMPPEAFPAGGEDEDEDEAQYEKPTKAWDIYSYGCVVLQIFSGNQPYAWIKQFQTVISALQKGREPFRDIQPHGVYQQLSPCLNKLPADRPTIDDIMGVLGPQ
ncbi:kinase-like domain-containing protein [Suillus lakei]|nr:kinase-like domain-containing protein [Suillus lakei]